jgi:hypothetical protein
VSWGFDVSRIHSGLQVEERGVGRVGVKRGGLLRVGANEPILASDER